MMSTKFTLFALGAVACVLLFSSMVSADGEEESRQEGKCATVCQTTENQEVCGKRGGERREFPNHCSWQQHNCLHPTDAYNVQESGKCS